MILQAKLRAHVWSTALFAIACSLLAMTPPAMASGGVRLIMVEQDGCRYCIEWDREIAPKYPKSAEGRFAPLQRAKRGDDALKGFNPVIYTPTFLVVRNGEEVGRVTGYAGQMFFYEELDEQLAKAGFQPDWSIPELDKTRAPRSATPGPLIIQAQGVLGEWSLPHAAN
jgi:hypothetical protein